MFDAITRLFSRPAKEPIEPYEPRLAVAALLVHLAAVDGAVQDKERQAIREALRGFYGLDEHTVGRLLLEATRRDADAVDFYQFTSILTRLPENERIEIVRMMWQVVFADHANHELEDNMVWRIAELIGVSARQRTILRAEIARGTAGA